MLTPFRSRSVIAALICCAMPQEPLPGQLRKLHTRDMTRLSQVQVAQYLKRSDIIFIPVGAVETNGIMPSDRDYVAPLAYAMTMADELDALYMPGLIWSYPGTTMIAPATVNISPTQGLDFLRGLAQSLLRSGFRRQVYISSGQGPAPLTAGTLVREFYDVEHVPILYIDMDTYLPKLKLSPDARSKALYGAHYITGRIIDLPLKGDYGEAESKPSGPVPENSGLAGLNKLGYAGSLSLGSWVPDVMAHGGGSEPVLPATAAEREEWGKQGQAQIIAIVKQMRLQEAMDDLKKHDEYTNQVLVPKFGKILPR
ncbi:MAG TPA: creatininase family protein [Candidatus Acidoferrales bacterium]|nr:creatininase family protein [Candidatus Acidoferrales bacterium]